MGLFIKIEKIFEDSSVARYNFWPSEDNARQGVVEIRKSTGEAMVVIPLPGDEKEIYGARAARKIYTHWKNGEYPERTSWVT
jgi:hypothetical protein